LHHDVAVQGGGTTSDTSPPHHLGTPNLLADLFFQ